MARSYSFTGSPHEVDEEEIRQSLRYADALQQQSQQPSRGQMVSGHYVGPSITQGLAKLGQAFAGSRLTAKALQNSKDIATQRQQAQIDALRGYATSKDPSALLANPDTAQFGMEAIIQQQAATQAAALKPPTVANVREGNEQVSKQYDPATQSWREIGRGAAFAPAKVAQAELYRQVHPEDTGMTNFDAWHRANKSSGAVSVNTFGSPVAAVDAAGNPVFLQPSKDGGAPSVIEDYQPPPKETLQDAADVASAKNTAEENKKHRMAFALYEAGSKGLNEGLGGTMTGPLVGKLPAFTTAQQVGAGSVAAMAPVLKQLFKATAEGTFTDADQRILLAMVPNRETTPEARKKILANMDSIIRAKLGLSAGASGTWDGNDRRVPNTEGWSIRPSP